MEFGQNRFPEHMRREAHEKPFIFFLKQATTAAGIFALVFLIEGVVLPSWRST